VLLTPITDIKRRPPAGYRQPGKPRTIRPAGRRTEQLTYVADTTAGSADA